MKKPISLTLLSVAALLGLAACSSNEVLRPMLHLRKIAIAVLLALLQTQVKRLS